MYNVFYCHAYRCAAIRRDKFKKGELLVVAMHKNGSNVKFIFPPDFKDDISRKMRGESPALEGNQLSED